MIQVEKRLNVLEDFGFCRQKRKYEKINKEYWDCTKKSDVVKTIMIKEPPVLEATSAKTTHIKVTTPYTLQQLRDMKMEEIRKIYDKVFGTRPKAMMIKSILIDEILKKQIWALYQLFVWISKTGFHPLYMQFMPVRSLQQIVNGKTEKQKYVIVTGHNYVFVCLLGQKYFLMTPSIEQNLNF